MSYRLLVISCGGTRRSGAVRTSVTLLVQNMGNTLLLIVYTPFVLFCSFNRADSRHFLQFIQTAICPNKTARRDIHLAQEESAKPNFQAIACDGFESNAQPAKALLRKRLWPSNLIAPLVLTRLGHICA